MNYLVSPVSFLKTDSCLELNRGIEERITMLDKLVELIVFTPKGNFGADPDFGFDYWNREYANVHYREFNNNQTDTSDDGFYSEITKKECQESIKQSLVAYAPLLKQVFVSMELNSADTQKQIGKKVLSRYFVTVKVEGVIDDGLGTTCNYVKDVKFFMEPTVKKYK